MQDFEPPRWALGDGVFRFLCSYHYCKKQDVSAFCGLLNCTHEYFLDSGAFSAETQGTPIDLDAYIQFIQRWQKHFTVVAALDVIRDADASMRNLLIMEDAGVSVIPAYHFGSKYSALEDLMERGYDYIGLGGMVGQPWDKVRPWIDQCFARAERFRKKTGKDVGFHGFGQTRHEAVRRYPWRSVDSSSWGNIYRFGRVSLYDPSARSMLGFSLEDAEGIEKLSPLIRSYGFNPDFLVLHSPTKRPLLAALSALSWKALETDLKQEIVRRRTNEFGDPLLPVSNSRNLYLAEGSPEKKEKASRVFLADAVRHKNIYLAENNQRDLLAAWVIYEKNKGQEESP